MKYNFIIASLLLFLLSCGTPPDNSEQIVEKEKVEKDTSGSIVYITKGDKKVRGEKVLNGTSEEEIKAYIISDLALPIDETPNFQFYSADVLGSNKEEIVCTAQLIATVEKKYGKFTPNDDRMFGYAGAYHKVYVINKEDLSVEKIEINASAVTPISIDFIQLNKQRKALQINYRIRESGFTFLYGSINGVFKQIFAMDQYNLKKYNENKLMVNYIDSDHTKDIKGYYNINIYDAEITNYNIDEIERNVYEFIPEIKKKSGIKRSFFLDTISNKYAIYI